MVGEGMYDFTFQTVTFNVVITTNSLEDNLGKCLINVILYDREWAGNSCMHFSQTSMACTESGACI